MTTRILSVDKRHATTGGFALFEVVLALAVVALLSAVILPRFGPGSGTATVRAKAFTVAALLREDRNAAIWRRRDVVSELDLAGRMVRSGASGRTVQVPSDMGIDLIQSDAEVQAGGGGFRFYPDGRSSGGVVTLYRGSVGYDVSVNWLTAAVTVRRSKRDQ